MARVPRAVWRPLNEPGPLGRAWGWALGATAAVATIVACLFPLANAMWDARLERDATRAPHAIGYADELAGGAIPDSAIALYDLSYEQIAEDHVEVIWLENLKPGAVPPPGLRSWPGPGEVIASPGLLAHPGGRQFAERYGALVGTISEDGLVSPAERLLYAGIDPQVYVPWNTAMVIDGFGATRMRIMGENERFAPSDQGYVGDVLYQWGRLGVFSVLALFAAAPCLVLIGVTSRLGGERRDQYAAWLGVVGASPSMLRRFLLREAAVPVALGAVAGLGIVGLAMTGTWPVPGTRAFIVGAFLQPAWPLCLAAALGSVALVLSAILIANRVRRRPSTARVLAGAAGSRPWLVLLPVAVIAVQAWSYMMLYRDNPGTANIISTVAAAVVVVLLAPCGGFVLELAGRTLARLARRTSSPAALVTSRELEVLPRPALRTSAVIGAAIVISIQGVLLMAGPNQYVSQARMAEASDAGLAATIGNPRTDSWLPRAATHLPAGYAMIRVENAEGDPAQPTAVRVTCDQLARLGTSCAEMPATFGDALKGQQPRSSQGLTQLLPSSLPLATVGSLSGQEGEVFVLSTDGRRIDPNEVTRSLATQVSPVPTIANQWNGWLAGAKVAQDQARWLLTAGFLAGAMLLLAAAFALWFEGLRVARRMAALTMMMDRKRDSDLLGIGLVGVPIAAATVMGILAAIGMALAPTSVPSAPIGMPWGHFGVLAAGGVLLSTVIGLVAAHTIRGYGRQWIPADDDA